VAKLSVTKQIFYPHLPQTVIASRSILSVKYPNVNNRTVVVLCLHHTCFLVKPYLFANYSSLQ